MPVTLCDIISNIFLEAERMVKKFSIKVEFGRTSKKLSLDENYKKLTKKISKANKNLDKSSQKFIEITSKFPDFKIKNKNLVSSIKLKESVFGMLYANIEVNNRDMKLIIDTGAEKTTFTNEALESLSTDLKNNEAVEVGSAYDKKENMEIAMVKNILIGKTSAINIPVLVINKKHLMSEEDNENIVFDGILGWDVLRQLNFELDHREMELRIVSSYEDKGIKNLVKSNFPAVLVIDKDNKLRIFGIDTGATNSWLNEKLIQEDNLYVIDTEKKIGYGAHGKEETTVNIIKNYELSLNDLKISFKNIRTGFTGFLNDFEFDGVFGRDILKNNILKLDNSKGLIALKRNNIT